MESVLPRRRLAVDAVVTQTGRVLQVAFSVASVVVLARALGPEQFGVFSTIVAAQTACFALADLGLGQLALRAVAQRRIGQASAIRSAIPLLYMAAAVVVSLSCILSLILLGPALTTIATSLLIGSSYICAPARIGVERGFWLGAHQFAKATILDISAAGLRTAAIVAVWLLGGASLLAYAVGLALSGAVTLFAVRRWLTYPADDTSSTDQPTRRFLLSEAAPFALSSLTWNSFAELPKMVLAPVAGPSAVGQYAAAARLLTAAYIPLQSLLLVMTPRLFAFAGRDTATHSATVHPLIRLGAVGTLAGVALGALVIGFASLLPTLLGGEYQPAVPVLRILALTLPLQALAFVTGDWLGGVGRQRLRFVLTLITMLLAVPVLLQASRTSGALGAATGYTALTALLALATAFASRRYLTR